MYRHATGQCDCCAGSGDPGEELGICLHQMSLKVKVGSWPALFAGHCSTWHPVHRERILSCRGEGLSQGRCRLFTCLDDGLPRLAADCIAGCGTKVRAEAALHHRRAELSAYGRIDVLDGVSCRHYKFITDCAVLQRGVSVDPCETIAFSTGGQRQLQCLGSQCHWNE